MNWLQNRAGASRRDCLKLGVGCLAGGGFVDLLRLIGQANEATPGKPYCQQHAALAYVKVRDRRDEAAA